MEILKKGSLISISGFFTIIVIVLILSFFRLNLVESIISAIMVLLIYLVLVAIIRNIGKEKETGVKEKKEGNKVKEHIRVMVLDEKKGLTKFVGSKKNKRYHLRSCRFAKNIGEKYLVESDDLKDFKGYTPCRTCKPNKK